MHIPDNIEQLHTKYQKLHLKEKDKKKQSNAYLKKTSNTFTL